MKNNNIRDRKLIMVSRCAWTLYNFRSGLMQALKKEGCTVIGGGAGNDGFRKKVESLGVPFFDLPVDKRGINPSADINLLRALYLWYRKERPDIVHHFTIKPVIYGSIAAKYAGIPKIVNTITGLGYVFTQNDKDWLRQIVHILYRVALKKSDFTFFQNGDDQRYFLSNRLINSQGTFVLPGSGVDCDYFYPRSTNGTGDRHGVAFLMLSRLLKDKGLYEFVEAARIVKKTCHDSRFYLLGRRDERNPSVVPKRELNQWQSEGVVKWLGEVEDVRPVIAKADVVVLPSYREGVSRSLLEAAAMEKPLITTDAVGCREIVEHGRTGLLVPARDAEALARAMNRMIVNPDERLRMGKEGRQKVEREFDEKIVLKKVFEIYNRAPA